MGLLQMEIAITGHTAGIGQALTKIYTAQGHVVRGLSKREGWNIRNTLKICDQIEPCDMFINNAQAGYAQTELLFEVTKRWLGSNKHIIVVSTTMTQSPISPLPGIDMDQYRIQKVSLELAVMQLRNRYSSINYTIVRPGDIATNSNKTVPPSADVDVWAQTLIDILTLAHSNNLRIPEISLEP